MHSRSFPLSVAAATILFALAGCKQAETQPAGAVAEAASVTELSIDQVATMIQSDQPPAVFDANSAQTRQKFGTVPGAHLLTSSSQYDPAETLPQDKSATLVFYCGSEACTAAKGAAKRASSAGWKDVNVMPAGIKGWSAAGKPTNQS
jgi:rhodanese-related sulfurtransferase